jgi:hypothetical protein
VEHRVNPDMTTRLACPKLPLDAIPVKRCAHNLFS